MRNHILLAAAFLSSAIITGEVARAQQPGSANDVIGYATSMPTDPVARLQHRIASGNASLTFDQTWGYLPALLKALDIPASSQTLVFSKTSLQVDRIGPWAPRALYFNDDVYIGWVQGGPIMEVASVDEKLGTIFYSLAQDGTSAPRFEREGSTCLMCHDSTSTTGGVPGLIVRSVIPDRHGYTLASAHEGSTSESTPVRARWGGWYATGSAAGQHMGNAFAPVLGSELGNVRQYMASTPPPTSGTVGSLTDRFDTTAYLTPHSDMVALLVLSHQARVHNLITSAAYESRRALSVDPQHRAGAEGRAYGDATRQRIRAAVEPLVRALVFADEQDLGGPVRGSTSFAAEFETRGPRDRKGRSLREFDLRQRLFKYPLSYLIYSDSFAALPEATRAAVYVRLREVLDGADKSLTHLSPQQRRDILEILRDTKPDFSGR